MHMNKDWMAAVACTVLLVGGSFLGQQRANAPAPQGEPGGPPVGGRGPGRGGPPPPMSFFVTSVGLGRGGNLGGLAGADAHCQALAAAVGRGNVTWRAYLSTQGPNAVNARDRIGAGPWYNQRGQVIAGSVAQLQGDTLDQARIGNFINVVNALDEKGQPVPGNEHDILTGSTLDGRANTDPTRDYTCNNWTSAADGGLAAGIVPDPIPPGVPSARLGHSDKGNIVPSWNSSHPSRGCSQASLVATGGGGRLYCFATN